jgi:hypothetical protein
VTESSSTVTESVTDSVTTITTLRELVTTVIESVTSAAETVSTVTESVTDSVATAWAGERRRWRPRRPVANVCDRERQ